MQVELIQDTSGFHELKAEWNSLLERSRADSVFLTWEYVSNWWRFYGDAYELRILTARTDEGRLVGVAPLMLGNGCSSARRLMRSLTFIGCLDDNAAEYLDFIVESGFERELIPRFYQYAIADLKDHWDLFELRQVPSNSPALSQILTILRRRGAWSSRLVSVPAPYLPLPGSWEELLREKSKNFRKQFNNHWNRLHKRHEVELLRAGHDVDFDEAFEVLIRLNHHRWGTDGKAFKSEKFVKFHRQLARDFDSLGQLYFYLLRVDGEYAAARFDFVYGGKLWNFQGGWSQEQSSLSLGRLFIGMSVKWCIDQGLKEYDFLAGEADYKRSWASDARTLIDVEVFNPHSWRANGFRKLRMLRNMMNQCPHDEVPLPVLQET